MGEGLNPTRRYKWFRPRQASRGSISFTAPNNFSTVGLFNDSSGAHYLIVRHWEIGLTGNLGDQSFGYVHGQLGQSAGIITPLVPGDAKMPGILTQLDDPTVRTFDWFPLSNYGSSGSFIWPKDFPFGVLPPGWTLATQPTLTQTKQIAIFLWEAITPDELDFAFEL